MKKKSYSVCSSQFRGTFGKDNGKIPKIIKNVSQEARLASNNFVEEALLIHLRFASPTSVTCISSQKMSILPSLQHKFSRESFYMNLGFEFQVENVHTQPFCFKKCTINTHVFYTAPNPLDSRLYALRRVKFEGSSMGMKPFLQKITSSRVEDLSRPRSKAPYCKHETTNRITCNKVAEQRKTRSFSLLV